MDKDAYLYEAQLTAETARTTALAKLLAAAQFDLWEDYLGNHLPDEVWRRAIPKAEAVLVLLGKFRV